MSERRDTFQRAYFDALYAADPDPWKFASSAYEKEKYAITVASLPRTRYASGLEVGCSIGVLTRALAPRCDNLLAVDAAAAPLIEAKRRCADLPNVRFEQMFVPDEWPDLSFELILLSELVYFMDQEHVTRLAQRTACSLRPGGDVVLVHWTGATNYPLSGDKAVELFIRFIGPNLQTIRRSRFASFRLDVLSGVQA